MDRARIKPVETIHHGYRMRSRLEARWAIFFMPGCDEERHHEDTANAAEAARMARFEHGEN